MPDRLTLPPSPQPPDPPPFPVVGVVAPIAVAAVLYAVLGTPTVLLLAVFTPVLAVAAVLDGRWSTRRRLRRDTRRYTALVDAVERELEQRRSAASADAHRRTPVPAALAADPGSWAGRPPSGRLCLGTADVPCEPMLTGTGTDDRGRRLLATGALVPDAPLVVPAECSVAAVGPAVLAASFDRAVAVARLRGGGGTVGCAVLERAAGATADLVVELRTDGSARILHASGPAASAEVRDFAPAFLTAADHAGAIGTGGTVPIEALLDDPADDRGLAARFLLDAEGPLELDLAADGPHAVVGGTTGSGKSALLTAWLLALARAHHPDRLAMLLVDCKGGAAFDPLAPLPHVTGVVTDLDRDEAERAVRSLSAELRRREWAARAAGVADATLAGQPRLLVVVDEYRALVEQAPALAALFADLAARGRSLGVHLLICTQRPGGSVRDEVLANCAVRICLRVHDPNDSRAVVGTDAAARLARDPVGAAILRADGIRRVRVPHVDPAAVTAAVAAIAQRHPRSAAAAPWLPPLPRRVALPDAPAGLVALGFADLPDEQRQPVLAWDPAAHPRLLVVGDPRSGRSTALAAAASGLGRPVVPTTPAAVWDAIARHDAALVVDDLDRALDRMGDQHAARAVERLVQRLRDPAAAPTVLALRGPGAWTGLPIRAVLGLMDEVLALRLSLDDHLALGGRRDTWVADRPPGRGLLEGSTVQVGLPPAPPEVAAPPPVAPLDPAHPHLVLTRRPRVVADRMRAAGWRVTDAADPSVPAAGDAVVDAPDAWQARWQQLTTLRARCRVVVDGVAPADLRILLGVGDLLPPLDDPDDAVLLPPESDPVRVRLP